VGSALLAVPATHLVRRSGRRLSLAATYFVAAIGAIVVVIAAVQSSIALLFAGFFSLAAASSRHAGSLCSGRLRAIYAAWAPPFRDCLGDDVRRRRWTHLAAVAGATFDGYRVPTLAGPFAISAALFVLAALALGLLRPDPAVLARRAIAQSTEGPRDRAYGGLNDALSAVLASPAARHGKLLRASRSAHA